MRPGDIATYVLALGSEGDEESNGGLWVVAEVPDSWFLLSSFYTGTAGGLPVQGPGTAVEAWDWNELPAVADGFQRLWVAIEEEGVDGNDSGEMSLEFAVVDVPHGEFVLKFWLVAAGSDGTPGTGLPAYAEINREPHVYRLAGSLGPTQGALEENLAVAGSRDGRTIVLGGSDNDISVLNRDPVSGALTHNHYLDDPAISGVADLVFAPDDDQVCGVDGRRLFCFRRDTVTGQLSTTQVFEDDFGGVSGLGGAQRIAISGDGASVYVTAFDDDAISFFDRDPLSGELRFVTSYPNKPGMQGPAGLAVSPDGGNVYVAGYLDRCVVVFDRDLESGTLAHSHSLCQETRGHQPRSVVVSGDGRFVYTANNRGHFGSVTVFARDPLNGRLSAVEFHVEGVASVVGLSGVSDVTVSPDESYLFVAGRVSLAVFSRDAQSGRLSFVNADFDLGGGVPGSSVTNRIALSADGTNLFYVSGESLALFVPARYRRGGRRTPSSFHGGQQREPHS